MATFRITKRRWQEQQERMERLGIYEADIEEKFVRSQGSGGQNINKVATCVYIKHRPTKISVKCQDERSQMANRFLARQRLMEIIKKREETKKAQQRQLREKEKRKKRRRPKFLQKKMLEEKRRHSAKKQARKKIDINKLDE